MAATSRGHSGRRLLERLLNNADAALHTDADVLQFVDALGRAGEDPTELLYMLAAPANKVSGVARLREALTFFADEVRRVQACLVPICVVLRNKALSRGATLPLLQGLVAGLYRTPGLLDAIERTFAPHTATQAGLSDADAELVTWLLLTMARTEESVRKDPRVHAAARHLIERGGATADSLATVLRAAQTRGGAATAVVAAAGAPSVDTAAAGGRHDNDSPDYRAVAIVPTAAEATTPHAPFLPMLAGAGADLTPPLWLDTQFRLLREDMLGPLRESLHGPHTLPNGKRLPGAPERFERLRVVGIALHPQPVVLVSFELPGWHRAARLKTKVERKAFWENNRRSLPLDSLVCIIRGGVPLRFAILRRRDAAQMGAEERPVVGLAFAATRELEATLAERNFTPADTELVLVAPGYFTYEPVLHGLQELTTVPFARELLTCTPRLVVDGGRPNSQDAAFRAVLARCPARLYPALASLNPSQLRALSAASTASVALIQGPPGTGKTHVGVLAAEMLLATREAPRLLCVCYTNHALDQFLAALLQAGINSIVRIGGQCKRPELEPCRLRDKAEAIARSGGSHSREQKKRYKELSTLVKVHEVAAQALDDQITESGRDWPAVRTAIKASLPAAESRDLCAQFTVPGFGSAGFAVMGADGKKVNESYLWRRWTRGENAAPFADGPGQGALWKLKHSKRLELKAAWERRALAPLCEELSAVLRDLSVAQRELAELREESERVVLAGALVIGATTTGAAKYRRLIEDAGVTVVIVEEAAEVLEAHVLTALGAATIEQVVLIGDHKQLRPKVENHELSVESGCGFNLNLSLFERLVNGGYPVCTLGVQHRMAPVVSQFVRALTYPELADADAVRERPRVRGLASSVLLVRHTVPEDGACEEADGSRSLSKTNAHEVRLVVALVRYLVLQGYAPDDLVVLTPYLGQLVLLQRELARELCVRVDDLDVNDVRRAGGEIEHVAGGAGAAAAASPNSGGKRSSEPRTGGGGGAAHAVRVATIDNYQGEEADIVIGSLVRSNDRGDIGFLAEPERVNVLLSRARCGMVLIGNFDTLCAARKPLGKQLWRSVVALAERAGLLADGVRTCCENHRTAVAVLASPDDFKRSAPDGGCTLQCVFVYAACGHTCTKRCHVRDAEHVRTPCAELVPDPCPEGHARRRQCGAGRATPCVTCAKIAKLAAEARAAAAKLEAEQLRWRDEQAVRRARIAKESDAARAKLAAFEERKRVETAVRLGEIEAERLAAEARIAQDTAPEQIEAQLRDARAEAAARIAMLEAKAAAELRNRQRQADAQIAKIEEDLSEETRTRTATHAAAERALTERQAQIQERLAAERARGAAVAAAAAAALAERETAVAAEERAALAEERERQARARDVAAAQAAALEHRAGAPDDELLAERLECVLCLAEHSIVDGILCPSPRLTERHFLCDGCFGALVTAESSGEVGALMARRGRVSCPLAREGACPAVDPFEDAEIARHVPADVFRAYIGGQLQVAERKLRENLDAVHQAEVKRLLAMDARERAVHVAVAHVREEILTLRCPRERCRQAFLDFDGCFALTCHACNCGFCAWCLADCDLDAHAHVAGCASNMAGGRAVYGTPEMFEHAHRVRRARLVRVLLAEHEHEVAARVREVCRRDFRDLELDV